MPNNTNETLLRVEHLCQYFRSDVSLIVRLVELFSFACRARSTSSACMVFHS